MKNIKTLTYKLINIGIFFIITILLFNCGNPDELNTKENNNEQQKKVETLSQKELTGLKFKEEDGKSKMTEEDRKKENYNKYLKLKKKQKDGLTLDEESKIYIQDYEIYKEEERRFEMTKEEKDGEECYLKIKEKYDKGDKLSLEELEVIEGHKRGELNKLNKIIDNTDDINELIDLSIKCDQPAKFIDRFPDLIKNEKDLLEIYKKYDTLNNNRELKEGLNIKLSIIFYKNPKYLKNKELSKFYSKIKQNVNKKKLEFIIELAKINSVEDYIKSLKLLETYNSGRNINDYIDKINYLKLTKDDILKLLDHYSDLKKYFGKYYDCFKRQIEFSYTPSI